MQKCLKLLREIFGRANICWLHFARWPGQGIDNQSRIKYFYLPRPKILATICSSFKAVVPGSRAAGVKKSFIFFPILTEKRQICISRFCCTKYCDIFVLGQFLEVHSNGKNISAKLERNTCWPLFPSNFITTCNLWCFSLHHMTWNSWIFVLHLNIGMIFCRFLFIPGGESEYLRTCVGATANKNVFKSGK